MPYHGTNLDPFPSVQFPGKPVPIRKPLVFLAPSMGRPVHIFRAEGLDALYDFIWKNLPDYVALW